MKAKIKATGEVVELYDWCEVTEMDNYKNFTIEQLEFISDDTDYTRDYWDKLLHQYAGMAMQGILSNPESELDYKYDETLPQALAGCAAKLAHALVQKLKGKEEK